MKCIDCQLYDDFHKTCTVRCEYVVPDAERDCEQALSIVGRELWLARQEWGDLYLYLTKPYYDSKWSRECWAVKADAPKFPYGFRSVMLPSYLYPEVTFENSPVLLKSDL